MKRGGPQFAKIAVVSLLAGLGCSTTESLPIGGYGGSAPGRGGGSGRGAGGTSGGEGGGGGSTDAAPAAVTLKLAWWGGAERAMRTEMVARMFEARYPHIKIQTEFKGPTVDGGPGVAYWPTMLKYQMEGTLPDIMQQDYAYIEEWTTRGDLLALDGYVVDKTIDLTNVPTEFHDAFKVNNKIMGITLGINTPAMAIDLDLFEKHKIPVPSDTWTWEDFEKIALQIRARAGIWGAGNGMWGYTPGWKSVVMSRGWWIWSADNKKLGYTDDQPWIEHWDMLLRLQKAGAIPNLNQEPSGQIEQTPIVSNQSGMEHLFSNQIVGLWTAADKASMAAGAGARRFKLLPIPRIKGGLSPAYMRPSQYFSVTAKSKHPREAAQFINFFTNDVEANKILNAERGVPISTSVLQALKTAVTPAVAESFDLIARAKSYVQKVPPNDPPPWGRILREVLNPRVTAGIMWRTMTPAQGVALFRQEAEALLAGGGGPDGGLPMVPPRPAADAGDSGPAVLRDAEVPEVSEIELGAPSPDTAPPPDAGPVDTTPPPMDTTPTGQRALLVVGATMLEAADVPLQQRLAAQGLAVDVVEDVASTTAMAAGKALIVISASAGTMEVGAKFVDVNVPVILMEPNLYDDYGYTAAPESDHGTVVGQTSVSIVASANALAAGLTGTVAVYGAASGMVFGVPAPGATKIATVVGNGNQATIFAYAPGAVMVGRTAPAKRMGFFIRDNTPAPALTESGVKLLDAAITWSITP